MECNGFQWHVFGKERYMKQMNDLREWQKKNGWIPPFDGKRSCLKRIGVTIQGRRVVEVGPLLIGSDKINVVADKVLSYFSV